MSSSNDSGTIILDGKPELESPQLSKRERTDLTGTKDTIVTPSRSEKVWIDDGNVILHAEQTLFRVHKSTLSRESSVFDGMFEVPQPPDEPTVDGCPIVWISDPEVQVEYFLKALYDGWWYYGAPLVPMETISAILRMARKYDCPNLRRNAMTRLEVEYPRKLVDWDNSRDVWKSIAGSIEVDIQAVNLASEMSLNKILPAAYAACISRHSLDDLLGGIEVDRKIFNLSPDAKLICVAGAQKFGQAQLVHTFKWLIGSPASNPPVSVTCTQSKICQVLKLQALGFFMGPTPNNLVGLHTWEEWIEKDAFTNKLCPKCRVEAKDSYTEGRSALWTSLPSLFGLPAWEDMKDD